MHIHLADAGVDQLVVEGVRHVFKPESAVGLEDAIVLVFGEKGEDGGGGGHHLGEAVGESLGFLFLHGHGVLSVLEGDGQESGLDGVGTHGDVAHLTEIPEVAVEIGGDQGTGGGVVDGGIEFARQVVFFLFVFYTVVLECRFAVFQVKEGVNLDMLSCLVIVRPEVGFASGELAVLFDFALGFHKVTDGVGGFCETAVNDLHGVFGVLAVQMLVICQTAVIWVVEQPMPVVKSDKA